MTRELTAWQRLSRKPLRNQEIRAIDRLAVEEYSMHSLVLMENAGIGCTRWLIRRYAEPPSKAIILCGRGNNGGDGLVIARHLINQGWNCQAYVLGPDNKLSEDAQANLRILQAHGGQGAVVVTEEQTDVVVAALADADLILDGMLGTGATGDPRPPLGDWITAANAQAAYRVALDIPTGVEAETGTLGSPFFKADVTLTFAARKLAMGDGGQVDQAVSELFGEVEVLPIGVPAHLIERVLQRGVEGA